jgi:hypothetical protein
MARFIGKLTSTWTTRAYRRTGSQNLFHSRWVSLGHLETVGYRAYSPEKVIIATISRPAGTMA